MNKVLKYLAAWAACAAALTSCKNIDIVGTNDGEGFFLNRTELSMPKGATASLVATVTPKGAAEVTWSSDNTSVATVDGGQVTAVGGGEAIITAKSGSRSLACRVAVISDVTEVSLSEKSHEMDKGETFQLGVTIGPDDINVKVVTEWTSSDEAVLKVSDDGLVTAVGGGEASIVVHANGVSDKCDFFVHCYPSGMEITPVAAEVNASHTLQFSARLLPDDVTETLDFEWSTGDAAYATVDGNGLVKGVSPGNTTVTVKAGVFSATASLTVLREIKTVEVRPDTHDYTKEELSFSFTPGCSYYGGFYGFSIPGGQGFTISVPPGYKINSIAFTSAYGQNDFNVDTGTYSRNGSQHSWTSTTDVNSVTFSGIGYNYIAAWTVVYE